MFAKPASVSFAAAASLLLVGTTAAEMLDVTCVSDRDVILVHGAAGGVWTSVLQQARLLGATVIETASESGFDAVRRFGATPSRAGPGCENASRRPRPGDNRRALLRGHRRGDRRPCGWPDTKRVVSTASFSRGADGIQLIGASNPRSGPFRAAQLAQLLALAAYGR